MELPASTPVTLVNWHDKEHNYTTPTGPAGMLPAPSAQCASTSTMTARTGDRRAFDYWSDPGLLPGVLDERPGRPGLRWHAVNWQ